MAIRPLDRLAEYANWLRLASEPPVLMTMDHRAVLVAAWAAFRQGIFRAPPILLRLDAHPDIGERPRHWAYERSLLTDLDSVTAVANDQRCDDGGWVMSAIQFGLCADVVTFFVHEYHRFPGDHGTLQDHRGESHRLFTFETMETFLSNGHYNRYERLLHRLGYSLDPDIGWNRDTDSPALWVDIDLDFATTRLEDGSAIPWTAAEMEAAFPPRCIDFFCGALQRADLVTIATEPEFAGGLSGVGKIADLLRTTFKGRLDWVRKL